MRRGRRAGFSLGELFLAMTIIIIAGGIVVASCRRAYRSARAASCTSNVKQLAIALRMYCTDWDRSPTDPRDFGALMPYIKNQQVLVCPAQREPAGQVSVAMSGGPSGLSRADYLLHPFVRLDDPPGTVIVGDDMPARHMHRYWIGARLDGACFLWPARQWQDRLGGVTTYAPPPAP
ncbi:MAG: DUF1559 domain-containing protein [Armatimonadetes bacterium]|nr:DUF1559 domain-containing protein [Armatimonadota bacterium]